MRKPAALQNRKGLPQKYSASQIIVDEEFLLSQTPQKSKLLNQVQGQDMLAKQIQSDRVQRWFNAEYFYSQMDRAYYAHEDFSKTLELLDIGAASMSAKQWSLLRRVLLISKTSEAPHSAADKLSPNKNYI